MSGTTFFMSLALWVVILHVGLALVFNLNPPNREKMHRVALFYRGRTRFINVSSEDRDWLREKIAQRDFNGTLWIGNKAVNMQHIEYITFIS